MTKPSDSLLLGCFTAVICLAMLAPPLSAQLVREQPMEIAEVGIDERSGEQLPLQTIFTTSAGRRISLGQVFDGKRPVILTLNYTDCPMLCKLQLSGLVDSLKQVEWTAGEQFRVVSISIDPSETPQQAAVTKKNHLRAYGRGEAGEGWSFLVGAAGAVQAVTQAAGFEYRYIPQQREFSHAAVAIICTPRGVISRYLYGVQFEPETLRLSLAEAADGRIGSPLDQLILYCYRYNSETGKYAPAAWNLMRLGAATTVAVLAALIIRFWFKSQGHPQPARG